MSSFRKNTDQKFRTTLELSSVTNFVLLRDRCQVSLLILSEFKKINFYYPEIYCFLIISGGTEVN